METSQKHKSGPSEFLEINSVQKDVPPSHKLQDHAILTEFFGIKGR